VTDRPAREEDEIEVTPEMIEAGASVLYGMETSIVNEHGWAERVYTAMETIRRRDS
jgi:hypothetical protein